MKKHILVIELVFLFLFSSVVPISIGYDGKVLDINEQPLTYNNAKTIYVDDSNIDGPWNGSEEYPYQYIQDGVNASVDGDTVFVFNGHYDECITINKKISLQGADKDTTTIDGQDQIGYLISINSSDVIIDGFKLKNIPERDTFGIIINYGNNCSIKNNIIQNIDYGIKILMGSNNILSNNRVEAGNISIGNYNEYSNGNNTIINNGIYSNYKLISIDFSSGNKIINNSIGYAYEGIVLTSSNDTLIIGNNIQGINYYGIKLVESNNCNILKNYLDNIDTWCDGIYLLKSSNNSINNNIIKSNEYGITFVDNQEINYVYENIIVYNTYGFYILDSNNGLIYHNNIVYNNKQVIGRGNNTWDDGYPSGGNYWDNYSGEDNDGDGIGDTPYYITGDNKDRYPLIKPWNNSYPNPPTIDGPTKGKSKTPHTYIFTATDPDGDDIYYWYGYTTNVDSERGDGNWEGPYPSGTPMQKTIEWQFSGNWSVLCKVKDSHELESDWVSIDVIIPRNKIASDMFLQRFMQNYPNLFPIFQKLLNRLRI